LGRLLIDLAALQTFPFVELDVRLLVFDVLGAVGLTEAGAREAVRYALLSLWDDGFPDDPPWEPGWKPRA
jgi:hypothetical protein